MALTKDTLTIPKCQLLAHNCLPDSDLYWMKHGGDLLNGINTNKCTVLLQYGLVLRQFVLWRFTFTTLVQSDRALPNCAASRSQLNRPFSTYCNSRYFPLCMCFLFFYFSDVLLSWLWFFYPWLPSKTQKRRKNQNSWRYIHSCCLLNHSLGLLQQNEKWFDWCFFFNYLCNFFLYT
jgi:hypothetical protein